MPRATWFCIDIECSGPVPGLYDMLSLGAVAVHEAGGGRLELRERFYVEIRPEAPRADPRTAGIHGLDLDELRRTGLPRRRAMEELAAWVARCVDRGSEAVFVGHNAPFDWSFVAWSFAEAGMPNPFGYKALDTKALAAGALGIHWLDSSKEVLAEALGLPPEDRARKHRADYDAWYQALVLRGLLERQRTSKA